MVSIGPQGHHDHPPRDPRALASGWLPSVLALEILLSWRPTKDCRGSARVDPTDERGKSAVGCAAHPWRAAQARSAAGVSTKWATLEMARPPSPITFCVFSNTSYFTAAIGGYQFIHGDLVKASRRGAILRRIGRKNARSRSGCGGRPRTRGDSAARKDRHQNLCVVKGASPRDCSGIISTASRVRAIRFSICGTAQIRLLRPDRSNHGNSSKVISSQVATFPPDRELRLRCEQEGYDKPLTRRHPAPRSHLVGHD